MQTIYGNDTLQTSNTIKRHVKVVTDIFTDPERTVEIDGAPILLRDWEIAVKPEESYKDREYNGPYNASEEDRLAFIESVVFHLHPSFRKPVRSMSLLRLVCVCVGMRLITASF